MFNKYSVEGANTPSPSNSPIVSSRRLSEEQPSQLLAKKGLAISPLRIIRRVEASATNYFDTKRMIAIVVDGDDEKSSTTSITTSSEEGLSISSYSDLDAVASTCSSSDADDNSSVNQTPSNSRSNSPVQHCRSRFDVAELGSSSTLSNPFIAVPSGKNVSPSGSSSRSEDSDNVTRRLVADQKVRKYFHQRSASLILQGEKQYGSQVKSIEGEFSPKALKTLGVSEGKVRRSVMNRKGLEMMGMSMEEILEHHIVCEEREEAMKRSKAMKVMGATEEEFAKKGKTLFSRRGSMMSFFA
jgi:hypothetical protein